jgi:heme/copper-type cytochrome/quinol oxidase subunit 4
MNNYFEDIGAWPVGTSIWSYVTGFVLSILLTLGAYYLAVHHEFGMPTLVGVLIALALIQFCVQAICSCT